MLSKGWRTSLAWRGVLYSLPISVLLIAFDLPGMGHIGDKIFIVYAPAIIICMLLYGRGWCEQWQMMAAIFVSYYLLMVLILWLESKLGIIGRIIPRRIWMRADVRRLTGALGIAFLLVVVIVAVYRSYIGDSEGRYDRCDGYFLYLACADSTFTVGDTVVFNLTIHGEGRIRLYKDRQRSFALSLTTSGYSWKRFFDSLITPDEYVQDSTPVGCEIDSVYVNAWNPYMLSITGVIRQGEQGPIFDFHRFGKFPREKYGPFQVGIKWHLVNPPPWGLLRVFGCETDYLDIEVSQSGSLDSGQTGAPP